MIACLPAYPPAVPPVQPDPDDADAPPEADRQSRHVASGPSRM